jgi:hypothetical protein
LIAVAPFGLLPEDVLCLDVLLPHAAIATAIAAIAAATATLLVNMHPPLPRHLPAKDPRGDGLGWPLNPV